jgi:Tol biopolymer transport system component
MREVRDRLRALDQIQAPDLRERIRGWEPRAPRTEPSLRRVGIALLAFVVAAAGITFAIRAFRAAESPVQPATTIENGKIAFSGGPDADVFVVEADGSGLTKLVDRHASGQEGGLAIAWSAEGTRIAFTDYRPDGSRGLYVMAADGATPVDVSPSLADADSPAWSPDGTKLAFTGFAGTTGYEIHVVNADGTGLRSLTDEQDNGVDGAFMPAWSPDGTRIAFSVTRYDTDSQIETHGIAVMNANGGDPLMITSSSDVDEVPVWSPDGSKIAFLRKMSAGSGVFVANVGELSELTRLSSPGVYATSAPGWSPDSHEVVFSAQRQDSDNLGVHVVSVPDASERRLLEDAYAGDPAWSPDGRWIAFVRDDGGTRRFAVWRMRTDGTDLSELAGGFEEAGSVNWQRLGTDVEHATPQESTTPVVEMGNGVILFRGGREGPSAIYEVRPDGSGLREVLPPPADLHELAWSPDGTRIAWAGTVDGQYGIYVSAADGTDVQQLTEGDNDGWPSWSPDGTQIVFSSTRYDEDLRPCPREGEWNLTCPTDLYVMGADGSDITRITSESAPEYDAAWSPDRSRIAFTRSDGYGTAIYVGNADGGEPRQVSSADGGSDFRPSWTPDSDRVVFGSIRYENWGIFEVTAKGTDERVLLYRQPLYVDDPIMSPDGDLIAFVGDSTFLDDTEPGEGAIALYVMTSNGTDVRKLAEVPGGVIGDIAWQPVPADPE